MANQRNRFPARRRFLKQSAALSAGAAMPTTVVLAQSAVAELGRSVPSASLGDESSAGVDAAKTTKPRDRPVDSRQGGAGHDVEAEATTRHPHGAAGDPAVTPDRTVE